MSSKKRLLLFVIIFPFISLLVYGLLSYMLLFFNSQKEIKEELRQYEQNLMDIEKNRLKEKVENLVNFINYYDSRSSQKIKDDVKKVVDTSVQVANNLYDRYHKSISEKDMKQMIIEALKKIKFEGNLGYLFLLDLKGNAYVHIDPKIVGTNIFDIKDVNGKYILHEFNKVLKKDGAGYVDYYWYIVSEDRKVMHYKISYVKMLKCYDWYVGGGEYLKYMKKFVKKDILDYIDANIEFKNGYFFITDKDAKVVTKPKDISIDELDSKDIVDESFSISHQKLIYTKFFKEYGWYVSGVEDLNEIRSTILKKREIKEQKSNQQKMINLYLLIFSWFLSFLLSLYLSYVLNSIFKRYEDELKQSNDKLIFQSKQALIGELFSMIAHQWRQPINKIASIVALLRFSTKDKMLDKKYKSIEENLDFMSETIDDFKTFYKPKDEVQNVDLKLLIEKSIDFFKNSFEKNGILLTTKLESVEYPIYQNEFLQVMINLLKNSIDSLSMLNQDDKRIYIELCKRDKDILIVVEDNGKIQRSVADKIFEPYFSTKKGSMGLGLYMSRMIVQKHMKGKINLKISNKSVRFYITLPLDIT